MPEKEKTMISKAKIECEISLYLLAIINSKQHSFPPDFVEKALFQYILSENIEQTECDSCEHCEECL